MPAHLLVEELLEAVLQLFARAGQAARLEPPLNTFLLQYRLQKINRQGRLIFHNRENCTNWRPNLPVNPLAIPPAPVILKLTLPYPPHPPGLFICTLTTAYYYSPPFHLPEIQSHPDT